MHDYKMKKEIQNIKKSFRIMSYSAGSIVHIRSCLNVLPICWKYFCHMFLSKDTEVKYKELLNLPKSILFLIFHITTCVLFYYCYITGKINLVLLVSSTFVASSITHPWACMQVGWNVGARPLPIPMALPVTC